jgi:hypothetical protein
MTYRFHHQPLTPAQMKYRYHEQPVTPRQELPSEIKPLQEGASAREDSDAFAAWLGHLAAGRIEVR